MKLGPIMILAVVVAVFGAATVFTAQHFLQGQSPQANRAPQVVASQVPAKTIVVAAVPLRFGADLQSVHLREVAWPAGATPIGAFNSISELLTSEGRRVVLSPIEASEPVLSWKVTGPGERATLAAVVDEGMLAISVRISDVLGVAGFVLPGDRVDIMLTRDNYTDILLQNVKILAIDQLADERADKPKSGKSAALEVNSVDAQMLTLAQTAGTLSLALRAAGSSGSYCEERGGVHFLVYCPPEFRQPIDTEALPFDPTPRVGVIRGMNRQKYEVPKINGDAGAEATALCTSLYAFPCGADGIIGPADAFSSSFSQGRRRN